MNRISSLLVCLVGTTWIPAAAAQTAGYYRFPTIHGDKIVFTAEGDLWRVGVEGGTAVRLTRDDGTEALARFSPSGRWIAFSGSYDGNNDVYLVPSSGGEPRRLTWHPDSDEVIGWTHDSRAVVFRSRRRSAHRDYRLFRVPVDGGQPEILDIGTAALAGYSANGTRLAFNRFSLENATWKRYLGGTAQDIWIGDLERGAFEKATDWPGADRFPMWHDGRVYFVSDRSGTMNIHSLDPSTRAVERHTEHDVYDARWPDQQGGRIVYMHAGNLRLYDIAAREDRGIEVWLPSDRIRHRPRVTDASKTLEGYALSADGGHMVLSSRGELWLRPIGDGRIVQLTRTPGIRERVPAISPNGEHVACVTDETGDQQLALLDADGKAERRVLEHDRTGWMNDPVWSPKGTHLAWSDLTQALFVTETATGTVTKVATTSVGEIGQYVFSPDGAWLAYVAAGDNFFASIHLYELASGETTAVTTPFTNDHSPTWDSQGTYLFFLSDRSLNPILGQRDLQHVVTKATKPCALILQKDGRSPFLPDELLASADEDATKRGDTASDAETSDAIDADDTDADDTDAAADDAVRIDLEGITARVVEFPLPGDNYGGLTAAPGKVYYVTQPTPGLLDMVLFGSDPTPRNTLHAFDLKTKKAEVVITPLRDFAFSADGKKLAWRVGGQIHVADAAGKPSAATAKTIDPKRLPLRVDPAAEWRQIFHEAWRLQRDFFWAENLANVDWDAQRAKFEPLLPRVSSRDELNDLIGQMIAELGTSHAYVMGGDIESGDRVGTGLLGADLELDEAIGVLRFTRVLRPEAWETDVRAPLTSSWIDVRDGDYLFAIDGVELGRGTNVHAALENLAGAHVLLTVGRSPDRTAARDVQIETLTEDRTLRYIDWCRRNREFVTEKSGGRFGYFHMPDMMGRGLQQFVKGFYPQIKTEGLVIDARYNGGGFVSQMVIERLLREPIAYMRPRRGPSSTNPFRTHIGHKVVLTNQLAGSDGDIFPRSFQIRRIGPVIGMRTWGGVVGISPGRRHVDGGMSTQPTAAWWEPGYGYDLENTGVKPDIEVDILPQDWAAGRDPQLIRAIAELERMVRDEPVQTPEPPPVPDKSRAGALRGGKVP